MTKSFESWEREELELTFDLKHNDSHPIMIDWLSTNESTTADEQVKIDALRDIFEEEISFWNTEEVKLFCIIEILKLINFKKEGHYKTFAERTIAANVLDKTGKNVVMRGRIEILVSAGKQKPRQPFFFIHEYKPLRPSSNNDPEGQLLSAMLTTQTLNVATYPLYGVYVQGKYWNFVILKDKEYAISTSFDATKEVDLNSIVSILKRCKGYIEKQLGI